MHVYVTNILSNLYGRFIIGDTADTLSLARWDPPFGDTLADAPVVKSSLTSPDLWGGDVINTVGQAAVK